MNLTMNFPLFKDLCQPVDPFVPVILNIRYINSLTLTLRTFEAGNDLDAVMGWLGGVEASGGGENHLVAGTFYRSYLLAAADSHQQALMVTIDDKPAIQIDVRTAGKSITAATEFDPSFLYSVKSDQQIPLHNLMIAVKFAFLSLLEITAKPALFVQVSSGNDYWHGICKLLMAEVVQRDMMSLDEQTIYRFDIDQLQSVSYQQ